MEEKKRGIKVEIFLFVAFFIVFAVFIGWLYRIYNNTRVNLQQENQKTMCSSYVYDVDNVRYSDETLSFSLYNRRTSETINAIGVIAESNMSREIESIPPGGTGEISINKILLNSSFLIYVNNCSMQGKLVNLK